MHQQCWFIGDEKKSVVIDYFVFLDGFLGCLLPGSHRDKEI
jgi:hypothetical protein